MTNLAGPVWMTPEMLASLETELETLTARSDADQARIAELRGLIRRAEVEAKPDDGLVEPGMIVTVRFAGDDSTERFLLGTRELLGEAALDVDVYSPTSPLGAAIAGRFVGDTVQYAAPNGAALEVEVLAATPFG